MDHERLRRSTAVKASISADGLVLLDLRGGLVLSSNAVGARIWELLEQERTVLEIARYLADEYGIADDRAREDAAAFVSALSARGLLTGEPRS